MMLQFAFVCFVSLPGAVGTRPRERRVGTRDELDRKYNLSTPTCDGADKIDAFNKLDEVLMRHGWELHKTEEEQGSTLYENMRAKYAISANKICETGLGGGHAALCLLLNFPSVELFIFDAGSSPYSQPVAKFLQDLFPNRTNFIWGDVQETIPAANNPEANHTPRIRFEGVLDPIGLKCDLIIVDGGRSYELAKATLLNLATLAASYGTRVLQIGCPLYESPFDGVYQAWSELASTGCVLTRPSLYHYDGRAKGMSEGTFDLFPAGPCFQPVNEKRVIEIYYDSWRFSSREPILKGALFAPQKAENDYALDNIENRWDIRLFPFGNASWVKGDAQPTYAGDSLDENSLASEYNQLDACALEHIVSYATNAGSSSRHERRSNANAFVLCASSRNIYFQGEKAKKRNSEDWGNASEDIPKCLQYADHEKMAIMKTCVDGIDLQEYWNTMEYGLDLPSAQSRSEGEIVKEFYVARSSSVNASLSINEDSEYDSMKVFVDGYFVNHTETAAGAHDYEFCKDAQCGLVHFITLLEQEVYTDKQKWLQLQRQEKLQLQWKQERELRQTQKQNSQSSVAGLHWACIYLYLLLVLARL